MVQDWKFAVDNCGNCGIGLTRKTPAGVVLATTPVAAEPDAPEIYAAPCPKCGRYNMVESPEPSPAREPAREPEAETEPTEEETEPETTEPVDK